MTLRHFWLLKIPRTLCLQSKFKLARRFIWVHSLCVIHNLENQNHGYQTKTMTISLDESTTYHNLEALQSQTALYLSPGLWSWSVWSQYYKCCPLACKGSLNVCPTEKLWLTTPSHHIITLTWLVKRVFKIFCSQGFWWRETVKDTKKEYS